MEQAVVAELMSRNSCFHRLPIGQQERFGNLLTDRLWLLSHKLRKSPFEPLKLNDGMGVNKSFPAALLKWVSQLASDEARLGALLIALGVQYFTRDQFDSLLTGVAEQYRRQSAVEDKGPFRTAVRQLTPSTDLHSRFTHVAQMPRTVPNDIHLEKWNHQAANLLANSSAVEEVQTSYYSLTECITDLLDLDSVLIEDWSLSGTTVTYALKNFLRICALVFGDLLVRKQITSAGHALPRVRVVTLVATDGARQRFAERCEDARFRPFLAREPLIVGCYLGDKDRITMDTPPAAISEIEEFVSSLDWKACVMAALHDFEAMSGSSLISYTKKLGFPDGTDWKKFVRFGFNSGGWLAVSHANCPSNSLPILWFDSNDSKFRPLFPRSESNHSSYNPLVGDWLATAESSISRLTPRVSAAVSEVISRR